MIGIVVAAHSSLSQLFQFGINMNTMILCAGNNIHYTMQYYAIPFRVKIRIPRLRSAILGFTCSSTVHKVGTNKEMEGDVVEMRANMSVYH